MLSYLSGKRVRGVNGIISLRAVKRKKRMVQYAIRRADLAALRIALHLSDADIKLAKSRFYPQIAAVAALKRKGDTLALNGDSFSGSDESYIGVSLNWNLYNGGSDRHRLEAVRLKKLTAASNFLDYRRKVAVEVENAFFDLKALKATAKSAAMQVKAQREYYRLTKGRFENQLVSADELSRSIADLAAAKAEYAVIRAQLNAQRAKIWLLAGIKSFKRALR